MHVSMYVCMYVHACMYVCTCILFSFARLFMVGCFRVLFVSSTSAVPTLASYSGFSSVLQLE